MGEYMGSHGGPEPFHSPRCGQNFSPYWFCVWQQRVNLVVSHSRVSHNSSRSRISLSTISCSRDLALIRSESFSDNNKHKLLLNKLFLKVNNNKVNRFNNNNSNVNQCNNNNANQYNNSNKHPQFLQGQKFSSMWPQIISNLVR